MVAEAGGLSGDQRAVAAVGAGHVDDVLVGLADRTVAGLGDAAAVQVQPQDRYLGAVLAGLGASHIRPIFGKYYGDPDIARDRAQAAVTPR